MMHIPGISEVQWWFEKAWGRLFRPDDVPSEMVIERVSRFADWPHCGWLVRQLRTYIQVLPA